MALQAPGLTQQLQAQLQWELATKRPLGPPSQRLQTATISALWGSNGYQSLVVPGVTRNKAMLLPRATSSHKVHKSQYGVNQRQGLFGGCDWSRCARLLASASL